LAKARNIINITLTRDKIGVIVLNKIKPIKKYFVKFAALRGNPLVWNTLNCLSVMITRVIRLKITKNLEESTMPETSVLIQMIEKINPEIAVIGSIASLCFSEKIIFQESG